MAKRKTSNAGLRAWRSLTSETRTALRQRQKSMGGQWNKSIKSLMGRGVRRSRISRGLNPNTGKVYSARDLSLTGSARKNYSMLTTAAKAGIVKGTGVGGTKRVSKAIAKRYR